MTKTCLELALEVQHIMVFLLQLDLTSAHPSIHTHSDSRTNLPGALTWGSESWTTALPRAEWPWPWSPIENTVLSKTISSAASQRLKLWRLYTMSRNRTFCSFQKPPQHWAATFGNNSELDDWVSPKGMKITRNIAGNAVLDWETCWSA